MTDQCCRCSGKRELSCGRRRSLANRQRQPLPVQRHLWCARRHLLAADRQRHHLTAQHHLLCARRHLLAAAAQVD
jgi:hypothetical protein